MIENKNYNLFVPPDHLVAKGRKNWNSYEADEYFNWLLSVKNKRISDMYNLLEYYPTGNISIDGDELYKRIIALLVTSPFSTFLNNEYQLTNFGLAVAADTGLILADFLLNNNSNINWKVIKKAKTSLYFNLPTLQGFGSLYFDPIGGMIAELKNSVNNPNSSKSFNDIFYFWDERAKIALVTLKSVKATKK